MKIKKHVCDICKRNRPDAKIKYKYRAKKLCRLCWEYAWIKIELCQDCIDKIIEADRAENGGKK